MKRILVTGATGFLGNNLVRKLLEKGDQVRVAVRASSSRRPLEDIDVEVVEVNLEDAVECMEVCRGVDAVIHSAGFIWFGNRKLDVSRRVNVDLTRNVASACKEHGIRLVHVSSTDVLPASADRTPVSEVSPGLPKPACNYVVTKTEADQMLRSQIQEGLDCVIVHPSLMFGPWDWKPSSGELIVEINKLGVWFTAPTGGISVVDVRDVADATIAALEQGETGRNYILSGHNIPYKELCQRIADRCGVKTPRLRTGPVAGMVAFLADSINRLRGTESIVNPAAFQMARCWHYYTSERAQKELGYEFRPLDDTLSDAVSWLQTYDAF